MPIPPRPIPAANRPSSRTTIRPGSSVPRKPLHSFDKLDWRTEIALLGDTHLPHHQIHCQAPPRSLPATSAGVTIVDAIQGPRVDVTERREVGIEGLIQGGQGKREKRATTATTLGFDFIPNPSIMTLPDTTTTTTTLPCRNRVEPRGGSIQPRSSLLTTSKSHLSTVKTINSKGVASPTLSNTPSTPALLPARVTGTEDDDDEDWEHVSPLDDADIDNDIHSGSNGVVSDDREEVDSQGEEDVIVLGELELEDESDQVDNRRAEKHAAKVVVGVSGDKVTSGILQGGKATRGVSYAAVLGGAGA